ncbi:hypothetical protein AGOR_G00207130 [Albula goreensis]|uniref:FHA domain-containing protein n=1 Tax=Albula goreensis TaxID=1534307 RepID=A0A8T3CP34_9TELE|nr:hypothetical protein AGOR_G00207130 [Albula goreensis]
MDQTQQLEDCFLEEEDEVEEELNCGEERQPLAKLRVFKNEHFPETELPLFLGDNVLGRDPSSCTVPLSARSVSKRHAIISLSLLRGCGGCDEVMEALLWDLGSMNGTRRGRLRLTPHVRYALSEGESVVLADLPCQYICMREEQAGGRLEEPAVTEAQRGRGKPIVEQRKGGKEATSNRLRANALPKEESPQLNVTESTSDSEEEIIGIRKTRAKIFDSSQDSGPTCSTLLFPACETVLESEDESCITLSSSKRLAHSVSGKTPTYVSDSEPEMDSEAEASKHEPVPRLDQHGHSGANKENVEPSRASEPVSSRKDQVKSSSHNSDRDPDVEGEEGAGDLPGSVCGNAASGTDREPPQGADVQHSEFNMDSDTDVEDEGNRVTVSAPDKNAGPIPAVQPTEFHLDSDTDVEGEEGTGDLPGPTCGNATSSMNRGEPLQGPNVQRTEFNMDSDTDVEDEGNGVTASEPGPSAGPVPAIKPVESLDSGRDVEESSEDPSGMSPRCNSGAGQANVKPQKLCSDSCVDAEDAKVNALVPRAAAVNALEILSDSDTDVEAELEPTPRTNSQTAIPSTGPAMSTACLQPDSDTDVEEGEPVKHQPAAKAEVEDFNMGSDTDVEDEAGQGTPERPAGPGCSTPLEQALQEEMETQAFLDTSDPFRRPHIPPPLKPRPLDDSQDDSAEDDLVIAATQCYVPEGGKSSPAVDPTLEATQPFAMDPSPAENMEDEPTQAFSFQLGLSIGSECTQPIGQVDSEAESELEATQAYGEAPPRGNTVEMDADPGKGSHIGISDTQPIATWEMGAREGEQEEAEAVEEEEWKGRGRRRKGKLPSGKEAKEKKKRLEKEERERVEREKQEKEREKQEKERLEQVRKEQEEKERLESEKKEREEKERLEREKREEEERERKENERKEQERERLEKERKEQEERERLENEKKEREKTERLENEKKEREEKERLEKEKRENEERQRKENERKERERERLEKERKEQEERERLDNEKKERKRKKS